MAVLRLNVTIDEELYPGLFEVLIHKGKQSRCELLRALAWEGLRGRMDGAKSADRQQLLVTAVDGLEDHGATAPSSTARRDARPAMAAPAPLARSASQPSRTDVQVRPERTPQAAVVAQPAAAPQPPSPVTAPGAGGAAQASPPAGRSASRSAARSLVKGGFVVG